MGVMTNPFYLDMGFSLKEIAAIAKGFGWTTSTVLEPDQLAPAVTAAFAAGGPHMVRIVVPA